MNANDTQVGGDHYKKDGNLQHWDLVIKFQWDYFQAQITRYIMRWKFKHDTPEKRLEDLKKARHFLDKYIASFESFDPPVLVSEPEKPSDAWKIVCSGNTFKVWHCMNCGESVTVHSSAHPPKGHVCPDEPQPHGYVNQDR